MAAMAAFAQTIPTTMSYRQALQKNRLAFVSTYNTVLRKFNEAIEHSTETAALLAQFKDQLTAGEQTSLVARAQNLVSDPVLPVFFQEDLQRHLLFLQNSIWRRLM